MKTLLDAFRENARQDKGCYVFLNGKHEDEVSLKELDKESDIFARKLASIGVVKDDKVLIMMPTSKVLTIAFYGVMKLGAVPCLMPEVFRSKGAEQSIRKVESVSSRLNSRLLITLETNIPAIEEYSQVLNYREFSEIDQLEGVSIPEMEIDEHDLAIIQATSGSTGTPKCVSLTHYNLLTNLNQINDRLETRPDDVFVSWLPLFHDMGLVGCFLNSMVRGVKGVLIPQTVFLRRPGIWFKSISNHRGTISPAPNFSYAYASEKIKDADIDAMDLSSWRCVMCGAEMIDPNVVRQFIDRFAPAKLDEASFMPCYGMAEVCLAVTIQDPAMREGMRTLNVSRSAMAIEQVAVDAKLDSEDTIEIVSVGTALQGLEIRLVDDAGNQVTENRLGNIEVLSDSTMAFYYGDADKTKEAFNKCRGIPLL